MDLGLQLRLPGLSYVTTGHEKTRVHFKSVLQHPLVISAAAATSCGYGSDVGHFKVSKMALEQF